MTTQLKLTAVAVWSDLRRLEVFLVGILNAWAIVAAFIHSIGVPAEVASIRSPRSVHPVLFALRQPRRWARGVKLRDFRSVQQRA